MEIAGESGHSTVPSSLLITHPPLTCPFPQFSSSLALRRLDRFALHRPSSSASRRLPVFLLATVCIQNTLKGRPPRLSPYWLRALPHRSLGGLLPDPRFLAPPNALHYPRHPFSFEIHRRCSTRKPRRVSPFFPSPNPLVFVV